MRNGPLILCSHRDEVPHHGQFVGSGAVVIGTTCNVDQEVKFRLCLLPTLRERSFMSISTLRNFCGAFLLTVLCFGALSKAHAGQLAPFTSNWTLNPEVSSAVITGDFDHDGRVDLAYTDEIANTITVLCSTGAISVYPTGNAPNQIVNLNGNLAVMDGKDLFITVLLNYGDPFTVGTPISLAGSPIAITAVDLNRDGIGDLAVIDCASSCSLQTFFQNASGVFCRFPPDPQRISG